MEPIHFTYWLQGFFELKKTIDHRDGFSPETIKVIEDHLQLVFKKVTPQYGITQSPVTTLPYIPKLGDLRVPDGFAQMATC
ncbi:hypothetical protein D3C75_448210 [compost metagenome]